MSSAAAGSLTPEEGPLTLINYVDLCAPLQHWVPLEQSRLGAFGDLYASVYFGKEVIVKMLKEQHRSVPSRVADFAKEVRITGLVQGVAGVVNAYGSGYDQNGNEFLVLQMVNYIAADYKGVEKVSAHRLTKGSGVPQCTSTMCVCRRALRKS